jgi:biotin-[acetyl-CoA-carboxylase] ligase BirA-like protein
MLNDTFEQLDIPGYSVARRFTAVSSTMDVARSLLVEGSAPKERGVVVAEQQLAGRGRQGRSWFAAEGAFIATFIFGYEGSVATLSGYSLAVGVALGDALQRLGVPVRLKWPNDLVVCFGNNLRKLGGILIEIEEVRGHRYVLVGIGINVESLPAEVEDIAVGVAQLRSPPLSARQLLAPFASSLLAMHEQFVQAGGLGAFVERWRHLSCFRQGETTLGVDVGSDVVEGVYSGIDPSGALVLQANDQQRLIHSGHLVRISI